MSTKWRYYFIYDFGTKVMAHNLTDLYRKFGGKAQMIKDNGGIEPDITQITEEEYEEDDGYDVM